MKHTLQIISIMILCVLLMAGGTSTLSGTKDNPVGEQTDGNGTDEVIPVDMWAKAIKQLIAKRIFYGIVRDREGKPVSGAMITGSVRRPDQQKMLVADKFFVHTDSDGLFVVEGEGSDIVIRNIEKEGYAFEKGKDLKLMYEYINRPGGNVFPSKDAPAEFILRKIGPYGHLLAGEGAFFRMNLEKREASAPLGKVRGDGSPPRSMYQKLPKSWPTLRVRLEPTANPKKLDLVFSGGNDNDQFFCSPQKLHSLDMDKEYPYQPEVRIPTEVGENDLTTWLIMRTVKPATISCIELNVSMPIKDFPKEKWSWSVVYESLTNPYGDPVLEESKELRKSWDFKRHLDKMAWAAWLREENPVRPDLDNLPKLLAEYEAMVTDKEKKRLEKANRFQKEPVVDQRQSEETRPEE